MHVLLKIWSGRAARSAPPLALAFASAGTALAAYGAWRALLPWLWQTGVRAGTSGDMSGLCGLLIIACTAMLLVLLVGNAEILGRLESTSPSGSWTAFLIRGTRAMMYIAHIVIWVGPGLTSAQAFSLAQWCGVAASIAFVAGAAKAPLPEARLLSEGKVVP